jgi:hydrogenase-4 component E
MEFLLLLLVLSNLLILGSSRLGLYIRLVAVQGILVAVLLLIGQPMEHRSWHLILVVLMTMIIKGSIFPWVLFRAIQRGQVSRELHPFIGFNLSLFIGMAGWCAALWFGNRLSLPGDSIPSLLIPCGMFTVLVGLFLLITRRIAITQVLGYLVMENGIFVFAAAIEGQQPLLVELGILLDVFAAVFIMVITLFQIDREIHDIHLDSSKMVELKD